MRRRHRRAGERGPIRRRSASRRSAHGHAWRSAPPGQPRLGDHVQPPDLGRMLRHRGMMNRQIVDEDGARSSVPIDDRAGGNALAALVADDLMAMPCAASCSTRQPCASSPRLVRMTMSATSPMRPRASSAPGTSLAVHLAAEEIGQQRPDAILVDERAAVAMGQCAGEIAGFGRRSRWHALRPASPGNGRPCAAAPRRSR